MIAYTARAFVFMMFTGACVSANAAAAKKLSNEAQATIDTKLQRSSSNGLLVFDRSGALQRTLDLDPSKSMRYKNLTDLLNSKDSPYHTCKKPTPTPPPGCVMCDDGIPVCTKAIQISPKF